MATLTLREKIAGGFLDQYQLDRKHLQKADKSKGVPGLRAGRDQFGQSVIVKVWPKESPSSDADLREIWRNEMLQLHRIGGSPGAGDVIAELLNSGEDTHGFYLVLIAGRRRPLASILAGSQRPEWLESPASAANKNLLWRNLKRLVQGLGALHSQGLLHRNLDHWAVLTDGGFEADFQLTGFEWSIRLTGIDRKIRHPKGFALQPGSESFLRDWEQLGELAVELFGLNRKAIGNVSAANHNVASAFAADEIKLLREMLRISPISRPDADYFLEKIDLVLAGLGARADRKGGKYQLALLLGPQSPLSRAIRNASAGEAIELDDLDSQVAFVRDDLLQSARAISLKLAGQPGRFKMVLQGSMLTYHLADAVVGKERTPTGWRAASCDAADASGPPANYVIRNLSINGADVEVSSAVGFTKKYRSNYSSLSSWESLRDQLSPSGERDDIEGLVRALWMAHVVECLFASADAFPIEIVASNQTSGRPSDNEVKLCIRPRVDKDRETLSSALLLNSTPGKRLSELLTESETSESGSWRLSEFGQLGDRSPTDTDWRFLGETTAKDGSPAFEFVGDRAAPALKNGFLLPADASGRDSQLKRRQKYISALETHSELARMISNPRSRVLKSDESIQADDAFLNLDESKQTALRTIIETLPVFFVQGPPGVGKTRLVRDLVRRRFKDDPSTRMLLSAQSNYAVDHLLHELEKDLIHHAEMPPLVIRCRAKDKRDEGGRFDVGVQAKKIAEGFATSRLVEGVDEDLRKRAEMLAESYEGASSKQNIDRFSQRAFEGLVLRSANAVFATTNSGDLERLVEERGQFDWTVVEESAKATGGELLAPMLLSHRRLLIGDHKQLAAFGTEPMLRILESPKSLRKAMSVGDGLIGRSFRSPAMDDMFTWIDGADLDEQEFVGLCVEAGRVLFLFEKFIEGEFDRQEKEGASSKARPIAAKLSQQHRMHPDIAELVSNVFYEGTLVTDPERRKYFETCPCPIVSVDPTRLPDSSVVWIDMPWVQSTKNKKDGDTSPRWNNQDERRAVLHALGLLSSTVDSGELPSIAILSPYTQQVKLIEQDIQRFAPKQFGNLKNFSMAGDGTRYAHTVDSFQGNEADVVVVSLVRNNSHGSIKSALGFLSNPKRMNVLLSRARWRLIIVGSLEFMKSAAAIAKSPNDADEIAFLNKLLSSVEDAASSVRIVPYATLRGVGA